MWLHRDSPPPDHADQWALLSNQNHPVFRHKPLHCCRRDSESFLTHPSVFSESPKPHHTRFPFRLHRGQVLHLFPVSLYLHPKKLYHNRHLSEARPVLTVPAHADSLRQYPTDVWSCLSSGQMPRPNPAQAEKFSPDSRQAHPTLLPPRRTLHSASRSANPHPSMKADPSQSPGAYHRSSYSDPPLLYTKSLKPRYPSQNLYLYISAPLHLPLPAPQPA